MILAGRLCGTLALLAIIGSFIPSAHKANAKPSFSFACGDLANHQELAKFPEWHSNVERGDPNNIDDRRAGCRIYPRSSQLPE